MLKIGHNIKYDAEVLARYGIEMAPVDDTMLLSYVLEAGLHGHGLDELCKLHFDHVNIKFADVAGSGRNAVTFAEVPLDAARDYAAEDADMTLRLHRLLKPRLVADRMATVYETLERPLVGVLAGMERAGIRVDASVLAALSRDFEERGAALAEKIWREAGHGFNIGSPRQLGSVLFEEMGLEGGKKTKQGAWATGADILENLAGQGHALPRLVLDWRQLAKLRSTYTEALAEAVNPATGRVHTSFGQAIASTGRLSSNDPNLQNIPVRTEDGRKIREAFVAEDGRTLLSADYSQIELRLLAHVADIAPLKQAFHEGADIHARTAGEVFGLPAEGMDPAIRNRAKAINFGIIYGISPFGLARQLGIPQGEAEALYRGLFRALPRHPRLHGGDQGVRAGQRLCEDGVRAALPHPGDRRQEPGQAQFLRTRGDKRAAPGGGGGYHQARHDPAAGGDRRRRARRHHAAPGARRAAVRGAGRRSSRTLPTW